MILAKKLVVLVFMTFLFPATGCIVQPFRAEVDWQQTVPVENLNTLIVENVNGSIDIRCDAARRDVEIRAVKIAHGASDAGAKAQAESIEITTVQNAADTLHIVSKLPTVRIGRSPAVRFNISLPADVELRLNARNGSLSAEGCRRDIDAETSNGRIAVIQCGGRLRAKSSNGNITARDVAGDLDVETSNGRIELERVGRAQLRACTTNGSVRILDGRGDGEIRSSNGGVEVAYTSLPAKPDLRVVTSNGNIRLDLPADIAADLAAVTSNGRVRAELEHAKLQDLDTGRSSLRARLNEGGGRIDVRSSNGSIILRTIEIGKSPADPPA